MLSLLLGWLFASEPRKINLDFKYHQNGQVIPIEMQLEEGKISEIKTLDEKNKKNFKFTFRPAIYDQDEIELKVIIEDLKNKKAPIHSEVITFDEVRAKIHLKDSKKKQDYFELVPSIL